MSAICNGMAAHGGIIPFCSTFFVFSDYMKNAMRMSSIMNLNVLYVLTHDSIGVGEDGPTHEPIEQLAALRSMPDMKVFRPCDGRETAAAYTVAFTQKGPTSIILTRQKLPSFEGTGKKALKGGYILADSVKKVPDVILIGAGSEVQYCMEAKKLLWAKGVDARVVSMPCTELFDKQNEKYKESVLPSTVRARVAVEAGATMPWFKYVGLDGKVIGIDRKSISNCRNHNIACYRRRIGSIGHKCFFYNVILTFAILTTCFTLKSSFGSSIINRLLG
jgi:transketolase